MLFRSRAFCVGATNRISERCRELRDAAERESAGLVAASPGTGIVLASVYKTENDTNMKYIRDVLGTTLTFSKTKKSTVDLNAYHAGKAHGGTINLNHQLGGSHSKEVLRLR